MRARADDGQAGRRRCSGAVQGRRARTKGPWGPWTRATRRRSQRPSAGPAEMHAADPAEDRADAAAAAATKRGGRRTWSPSEPARRSRSSGPGETAAGRLGRAADQDAPSREDWPKAPLPHRASYSEASMPCHRCSLDGSTHFHPWRIPCMHPRALAAGPALVSLTPANQPVRRAARVHPGRALAPPPASPSTSPPAPPAPDAPRGVGRAGPSR